MEKTLLLKGYYNRERLYIRPPNITSIDFDNIDPDTRKKLIEHLTAKTELYWRFHPDVYSDDEDDLHKLLFGKTINDKGVEAETLEAKAKIRYNVIVFFGVLVVGLMLVMAYMHNNKPLMITPSSKSSNDYLKDRRCEGCGTWIGPNGYENSNGVVAGPWENYKYCSSCAEKRTHQF